MKYIKSFGKLFESTKSRTEFKSGDKSEFYSEVNRLSQKYGLNPRWHLLNDRYWDRCVRPRFTVYLFEIDEPIYLNPLSGKLETKALKGKHNFENGDKVSIGPHIIFAIIDDEGRFWDGYNHKMEQIDERLLKSLIGEETEDSLTELKETVIDLLTPIIDCGFAFDANWKVRSYSEKALYINLTSRFKESILNKSDLTQSLELILEVITDWDYKLNRLFLSNEEDSVDLTVDNIENFLKSLSELKFNPTKILFVFTPLS